MSRFTFEIIEDARGEPEPVTVEYETLEVARREAIRTLGDMMQETLHASSKKALRIDVKDETKASVFWATLVLESGQLQP